MNPEERDCYIKGEANLTHLTHLRGYEYSLDNCIVDQLILDIKWYCGCLPAFANEWVDNLSLNGHRICFKNELNCAYRIMDSVTLETVDDTNITTISLMKNNGPIRNASRPSFMKCLPSCKTQKIENQMSTVDFPQRKNFFNKKKFCHVASHILQVTCKDEDRKYFLDMHQPKLCEVLESFDEFFGNTSTCKQWPRNYKTKYGYRYQDQNKTLKEEMFQYGSENLAFVQIMMQSPYVTKIKRDVAMTFTTYVGNTGGLLGLCLGCSFISLIEILFWICCCGLQIKK